MKAILFCCVILLAMFLAGLLLGPGYYVYCRYLSGSEKYSLLAFDKDINNAAPYGKRLVSEKWNTPLVLSLSPEMNHVGFFVTYNSGTFSKGGRKAYYTVELKLGDENVWTRRLKIAPNIRGSTKAIGVFTVKEASDAYNLYIREEGDKLAVGRLFFKVRSEIWLMNRMVFVAGCLLLAVSSFLLVSLVLSPRTFGRRVGKVFGK
ncbi:MAG: hypothetical protein ACYS9T_03530 [Planctomycetota bacterium]|jgi:hypothetical protein